MNEIKYPCLMQAINNNSIVEFTGINRGSIVAQGSGDFPVGHYSELWVICSDIDTWKPYNKLENKTVNVSISTIEALARLEAIEAEQKELRKLLEASEKKEAVGSLLNTTCENIHAVTEFTSCLDKEIGTKELAEAYSSAFETFIKLRQQPGSVGASIDGYHYFIHPSTTNICIVTKRQDITHKLAHISPCFSTQEYAEAAIKNVGEETILQMMRTFSHYEGE